MSIATNSFRLSGLQETEFTPFYHTRRGIAALQPRNLLIANPTLRLGSKEVGATER